MTPRNRRHYTESKLANVPWAYALDRHLKKSAPERGITVAAFDPGLMPGTGLIRDGSGPGRFIWNSNMRKIVPLLKIAMTSNIHRPSESGHGEWGIL
ncbi:hypothetical protein GGR54DRAFT_644734 [Hypoxylon sp. NC1633]|nr:hypothetical protein GGR54DRAFT_644734 [Hypoxylon sp. NC1633]